MTESVEGRRRDDEKRNTLVLHGGVDGDARPKHQEPFQEVGQPRGRGRGREGGVDRVPPTVSPLRGGGGTSASGNGR